MSTRVVMYSTRFCPYCIRARGLLESKQVSFTDIAVDGQPDRRQEMEVRSGRYTVPQIWIGEHHVGGYDDLALLERQGRLDELLAMAS
ncbi:MAG: glutaredoxin 3 [Halioglobus sp.]|nr:glutaredoxin 3 [Halioglobus sp.]MCB1710816.1 glutaredoxin 3 [Halioglobus sp.]MCP5121110.1 glutaredoxin 3 [Pseudomonadales bacterium]MCP5194552.1 glutaredoxin 3 [Pseudomonadales bacterium]